MTGGKKQTEPFRSIRTIEEFERACEEAEQNGTLGEPEEFTVTISVSEEEARQVYARAKEEGILQIGKPSLTERFRGGHRHKRK